MKTNSKSYRQTDKLTLSTSDLNPREKKVLGALAGKGSKHVKELARACFPGQRCKAGTYGKEQGGGTEVSYRTTLNSLRRLVAAGFVRKVEAGTYAAVEKQAEVQA